jgi:hypothetical protein
MGRALSAANGSGYGAPEETLTILFASHQPEGVFDPR